MVRLILKYARTSEQGAYGDGKIFISPIDEVYTISSGIPSL
jgi:nitrogen regulatory protein PII 1